MDIVNFQQVFDEDNLQEDYELNSTFPPKAPYHLRHLIEFRLQLLLKENLSISPGETKLVATACNITEKLPRLSIYIKAPEKLPLLFESEGYVSHKYRGRIFVRVTNYSPQCVSLPTSTNIGYLLVQNSSL